MNEWSLLLFTLALQIAAGGVIALALVDRLGSDAVSFAEIACFTGIALLGMAFSLTHLGDMAGAYRALYHPGTSWLSREVWLAGVFAGLALFCSYRARNGSGFGLPLTLAALAGLLLLYASSAVYAASAVAKWNTRCPYAEFFASALLLGPFLAARRRRGNSGDMRIVQTLFSLGVILLLVNAGFFGSAPRDALTAARFGLAGLGIVLAFRVLFTEKGGTPACLAAVCLILGEGLGRYMFFAE